MYERSPTKDKRRCTAAGRYMDTDGRVICERCAAGLVVTRLTDVPKLIELVGQIVDSDHPLTDIVRAKLQRLVIRAPWIE
jgi:hypothetical protein